ncbi:putative phosphatase [Saprospira grandis DSM 2844]|uniref:Putative phosphatase n=1 Tax=Saprospira grandis DSM 2844 TaxID=694433 RepID=J0P5M4_9BACT|nr:alkaline phosphatase PhoX [Saprospira grandis]EJF52742.1 putative phosphatase [Saprospira grandis DSM 2844]
MKEQNRRSFLQFLGRTSLAVSGASLFTSLESCGEPQHNKGYTETGEKVDPQMEFPFKGLAAKTEDQLLLDEGLEYQILAKWQDEISPQDKFGFNNDYTAYIPLQQGPDLQEGLLWVNHEYLDPLFVHGFARKADPKTKTKEAIDQELYEVGGSILHIQKKADGPWTIKQDSDYNRRLNGFTEIPFDWPQTIAGKKVAMGTFGNCAGGVTPWGSILTCEENYQFYYGESDYSQDAKQPKRIASAYGWEHKYPDNLPEHYGWVVEVNIKSGKARKLVALGRCAHECAQVHEASDGRLVVYTGDDKNDEHIYKFVSSQPGSLTEGTLYVANTEKGEWLSLNYEEQPILQEHFKDQTEVLIRLREAAKLLGATPLNRPEDIEFDPQTGHVLITLTNNIPKGDYMGKILKIEEESEDKTGLKFKAEAFLTGGADFGFACPDNMAFDPKGNLWFTSDISGSKIGKAPYTPYGNNSLFVYHQAKDKVVRVASAPKDAELTGPYFTPDGRHLFLSVQHPGETSPNLEELSSHWPEGGDSIPRSAVVVISGPSLDKLMGYNS